MFVFIKLDAPLGAYKFITILLFLWCNWLGFTYLNYNHSWILFLRNYTLVPLIGVLNVPNLFSHTSAVLWFIFRWLNSRILMASLVVFCKANVLLSGSGYHSYCHVFSVWLQSYLWAGASALFTGKWCITKARKKQTKIALYISSQIPECGRGCKHKLNRVRNI